MHATHPDVQTSAHATTPAEPDMFADAPPAPVAPGPRLYAFRGDVVSAVVIVEAAATGGHACPVLHLHLSNCDAGMHTVHITQPFPLAERARADGLAAALRQAKRATVLHTLTAMRVTLPHAHSIEPLAHH